MSARARWTLGLAALAVFALLAWQVVVAGPLTRVDLQVTQLLAAHRTAALTQAMRLVSRVHGTYVLLAAAALLAGWRWSRRDLASAQALVVVPFGELLNVGLKQLFRRPRPGLADALVHIPTFSFPSGHAVASTVFYGALCALVFRHTRSLPLRVAAATVALGMVLLVASSRVYLGAHYLSDVLAGMAVGGGCLALLLRPTRR